jgi:hypothetical protein
MTTIENENNLEYEINTAIADALVFGYAAHVNPEKNAQITPIDIDPDFQNDIGIIMEKATKASCLETCARSIYHLWNKYPDLFPQLFLMRSYESENVIIPSNSHFTRDFFNHIVWGAVAVDGRVFFGSPNNAALDFIDNDHTNPLSTFHEGDDLTDAYTKLVAYEGGLWADVEFIQKQLSAVDFPFPEIIMNRQQDLASGNLSLTEEDLSFQRESFLSHDLSFSIPVITCEVLSDGRSNIQTRKYLYDIALNLDGQCNKEVPVLSINGYWNQD